MNKLSLICFILLCAISCTSKLPVFDNGDWVKMQNEDLNGSYFMRNDSIFIGFVHWWDQQLRLINLKRVDLNTFEICDSSDYARDCNNIYYPLMDSRFEKDSSDIKIVIVEKYITGADPKSFRYIGNGYGADKRHMYRFGKRIKWDNEVVLTNGTHGSDWVELPEESMDDKSDTVP